MPDLAKVIKGIECTIGMDCKDCPYDAEEQCTALLLRDALELLKEREQIVQCKNCKFRHDPIRCRLDSEGLKTPDDWFCADGKRR